MLNVNRVWAYGYTTIVDSVLFVYLEARDHLKCNSYDASNDYQTDVLE